MSEEIKICEYKDLRDVGMLWLCKCIDCRELFLGIKGDFVCEQCCEKEEINNGDE